MIAYLRSVNTERSGTQLKYEPSIDIGVITLPGRFYRFYNKSADSAIIT